MTEQESRPLILIVSTSLNPHSNSRRLAARCLKLLQEQDANVKHVDLRDYPLPHCDGEASFSDPQAQSLQHRLQSAEAIIIACPIYNFNVSGATKNMIELTGVSWNEKIVGIVCSSGGHFSHMAPMAFANSLMLDFRCLIVPRFVYATRDDFDDKHQPVPTVNERLTELTKTIMELVKKLCG